ncbi:hypothetical protein [Actinomadura sp. 3N407]|uniref:hypothetical protein n=1 Tax=Actinomadura sp. 3N407 TaxID=3457423 RepID=UPI003FCDCAFE
MPVEPDRFPLFTQPRAEFVLIPNGWLSQEWAGGGLTPATGTVLFLIALATGMYTRADTNAFVAMMLHPLALLMVLPIAAFIGAFAIGAIRRR